MNEEKGGLVPLTGLWKNVKDDGSVTLSGYLGQSRLIIIPNKFKEKENQPDYVAMVAKPMKKQDDAPAKAQETDVPF